MIVSAFWITLRQLRISQENQARNFNQIEFIQNDILDKRNKEIRVETLNQVKYFQNEIQESIEALINDHLPNSFPIIWRNLQENPISENLYQHHRSFYDKMTALDSRNKNKVNLILRKIDSFSAFFLHSSLDSNLAFQIIGNDFLKQTDLLLGPLAFFRKDENSTYCAHLLELKTKWSNLH
ncbi:hypothetical protein [Leeuwenhoekiella parthenopeia]|uniref:hypothetical protein n=1 Tax=Leeuwenhoekiella parthenopeia TaxID=2890320 RepID=UPI001D1918C9|nr:hypothetical protein [Leeuwenhoekiella parthenopeia]